MRDERWELAVTPTAAETYEAMVLAGKSLIKGRGRVILIVQSLFVGFFAPLGAVLLFWVVAMGIGNRSANFDTIMGWGLPVTLVLFGLLTFWLNRQSYFMIAEAGVRSRFGRFQQVVLDQSGITLTTENSRWHSGWADVEMVRGGKTTLFIGISGIAIAVPRRVFLGPKDAALPADVTPAQFRADLQRWLEAAR